MPPPLIAHVVFRFDTGGMENGMVNLINHMPEGAYRHAIVCLTDHSRFAERLRRPVEFIDLRKREGHDLAVFGRVYKALRRLKPDLVHTRNLAALETQPIATLAGVRARVHGEHGRDVSDLTGSNTRYNRLRRAVRPFVGRYIAVSQDLAGWLESAVGVPAARVRQVYNGVDTVRFHPRAGPRGDFGPAGFCGPDDFLVGSVGRMAAVKNFPLLLRAFTGLATARPDMAARARLLIVGDGVARAECERIAADAGLADRVWFAGERADTAELMRAMDLFVLPSLGEGISNTILEAMASGLPVLATAVGGNPELVDAGITGTLVPSDAVDAMSAALGAYLADPDLAPAHGRAGRAQAEARFSLDAMVAGYLDVYDSLTGRRGGRA